MNIGNVTDTDKKPLIMKEIKNIAICGLGGLGCICATQISKHKDINLKIVVDKKRFERYKNKGTCFNGDKYYFDLILPDDNTFKADLAIIATKNDGLSTAVKNMRNFVKEDTIFMSLLNGIESEDKIAKAYGYENVLISFYIGHSCIREGRNIQQDGTYKFVIGNNPKSSIDIAKIVSAFFDKVHINYEISNTILDDYWKKYMINVGINQLSAITGLTLKEIKKDEQLTTVLKGLMKEVESIAGKSGIYNHKQIYQAAESFLLKELEDAMPSMLQDLKAGRKTEVDIFSGTIIRLGKKYKIATPYNDEIYKKIKKLEEKF